jgi:hypothetical protein
LGHQHHEPDGERGQGVSDASTEVKMWVRRHTAGRKFSSTLLSIVQLKSLWEIGPPRSRHGHGGHQFLLHCRTALTASL